LAFEKIFNLLIIDNFNETIFDFLNQSNYKINTLFFFYLKIKNYKKIKRGKETV